MMPFLNRFNSGLAFACAGLVWPLLCFDCLVQESGLAGSTGPAHTSTAVDHAIIDHMDGLEAFFETLGGEPSGTTLREAYRRHFVRHDPLVYHAFVGRPGDLPEAFVNRLAELLPENRAAIGEYTALARAQVPEATAAAAAAFGAELETVPQYLTLNLLQSNAQVRIVEATVTIFYGMDSHALTESRVLPNTPRDLRPTVAHELFHAHHWSVNPFMAEWAPRFLPPQADAPLWINLWSEGLATCASRHVYPDADMAHLMSFEGVWEEAEPRLAELAGSISGALEATDPETTAKWLYIQLPERDDGLPNKAGYSVALAAADRIVADVGLKGATRLAGGELFEKFSTAIGDIAEGAGVPEAQRICRPRK